MSEDSFSLFKRRESKYDETYNLNPIVVQDILKLQTHLGPPLSCPGVGVVRKHRLAGGQGLEVTGTTTGFLLISVTQLLYHLEAALDQMHERAE